MLPIGARLAPQPRKAPTRPPLPSPPEGFDAEFAGNLFGVLQRLPSEKAFTGTGIGLALAKRIVERHEGKVRAEAEIDQGAASRFTPGEVPTARP